MKYSLGKAAAVLAAMAVLPVTVAVTDAEAATATDVPTCSFNATKHTMTVSMTGAETSARISRSSDDRLLVNADLCESSLGKAATVYNTRIVRVTGSEGEQSVNLDLSGGQLAPGFGDEPGASDEIEVVLKLGSGTDVVHLTAGDTASDVRAGTKRDGISRLNLNADETDGVDPDVTMRSVESVIFHGGVMNDRFIGTGGVGTGRMLAVRTVLIDELGGNDLLVGGRGNDSITDNTSVVDSDTLRGGPGADVISVYDPDTTGDLVDAGPGADTCAFNEPDVVLNCEDSPSS
jgi:hypothetical protein